MASAVLGSKPRNDDTQKGLLLPQEAPSCLLGFFFPPLSTLPVLTFSRVPGPRAGSTALMSYEGSQFPDACDLHTSSQTATRHLQPQPGTQTAPLCSGSLLPPWELLLRKLPPKPGTHSLPAHAPQCACGLSGVWFPAIKITNLGETFLHTRKAESCCCRVVCLKNGRPL